MMRSRRYLGRETSLILISLFVISFAVERTIAQQKSPSNKRAAQPWYLFTGPDGEFSLAFPAKPLPFESPGEGPVTVIRHYHLSTSDGKYFSVNFQDIGGDPPSRDANEFGTKDEVLISDAARQRGESVIQVHRLAKNTIELQVWQSGKDTTERFHRIDHAIVHRARIYTLSCGSLINNKDADKAACKKFFNSIRFRRHNRAKPLTSGFNPNSVPPGTEFGKISVHKTPTVLK